MSVIKHNSGLALMCSCLKVSTELTRSTEEDISVRRDFNKK